MSRLDAVKTAAENQIRTLKQQSPNICVGLIAFGSSVSPFSSSSSPFVSLCYLSIAVIKRFIADLWIYTWQVKLYGDGTDQTKSVSPDRLGSAELYQIGQQQRALMPLHQTYDNITGKLMRYVRYTFNISHIHFSQCLSNHIV